jgi:hypothetical protein
MLPNFLWSPTVPNVAIMSADFTTNVVSLKSDIIFNFNIKIMKKGISFMELHFQQYLVDWNLMKVTYAISVSDARLIPI